MNLRLDWCSSEAAAYAVLHWHYARNVQPGKSAKIGVWENSRFVGAVIFTMGSGSTTKWATRVQLDRTEMAELSRVALWSSHQTPVSRILAIAVKMLRKQSPGLRLLVSYADPVHGHHGGIYQAAGWIYCGPSSVSQEWIAPDGRRLHNRELSGNTGTVMQFGRVCIVPKRSECQQITNPPKHKYLFPLDPEIRERIAPLAKPYPRRVGSIPAETPVHPTGEGGATPTPTLHYATI